MHARGGAKVLMERRKVKSSQEEENLHNISPGSRL